MSDFHPETTAKPQHVTIAYQPDGSLNPSAGVVLAAVLPSGREQLVNREVELSEADTGALNSVLGHLLHQAMSQEGIGHLYVAPEPELQPPAGIRVEAVADETPAPA